MKILVVGGNGFIGNYLVNFFKDNDTIVTTLGKSTDNDYSVDLIHSSGHIKGDYDIIVHAAGIVHNEKHASSFESETIIKDLSISFNLLNSIRDTSYSKFIFLSSVSVYGLIYGDEISVNHKVSPKTGYGLSKKISEDLFLSHIPLEKLLILRLPLVNGPFAKGNIHKLQKAVDANRIFIFRNNYCLKSILEIDDLANFIKNDSSKYHGIHQIKSYDIKFNDFVKSMSKRKILELPFFLLQVINLISSIFHLQKLKILFNKISRNLTFKDTIR